MNADDFDQKSDFKYLVGEKPEVIVVMFYGKIGSREIPILEQLSVQLNEKSQKIVLLNFHDLLSVSTSAHAWFSTLQKLLRDKEKLIGLCGIRPEVRKSLVLSGVVREAEIYNNVPEAWKELSYRSKL